MTVIGGVRVAGDPATPAGGAFGGALLAALVRPAWWLAALASFLLRGGIILVALPIIQLPTVAGLANEVAPILVGFVFGGVTEGFLIIAVGLSLGLATWYVVGGWIGAWMELSLSRWVSADDEVDGLTPAHAGDSIRAFVARSVAHLPTALVITWGAVQIVEATYEELIRPGDPLVPIVIRVAFRVPAVVAALVVVWLVGETIGGIAVRRLAWGASIPRALGRAALDLVRPAGLATLAVTSLVVGLAVAAMVAVNGVTWEQLRVVLIESRSPIATTAALVLFATTWLCGLWIVGLALAWRSATWTVEVGRRVAATPHLDHGTIGPPGP